MAIKNWERIHNQKANPIIIASHIDAIQRDLPWESCIRDIFMKNGMLDAFLAKRDNSDNNKVSLANMLLKRQIDQFNQTSMETIRQSNKLKILSLLNAMSKFVTLIVTCGDNFPNFCPIDVFSLEMDSLDNVDNFVGQFTGLADI